tara:strand:+ start:151 stop:543 length:393 start_codon:yes stop_codon:yes gene_type:complete
MGIDTKKISLPKTAEAIKVQTVGDKLIAIFRNEDGEMIQKTLPGNVNKEEEEMIKVGDKTYKVIDGKVTEVKTSSKKETKRSIGPAGASIVSDDGKRIKTANLAKGGIVKKKSSRTRIAKKGFGIAKRGY